MKGFYFSLEAILACLLLASSLLFFYDLEGSGPEAVDNAKVQYFIEYLASTGKLKSFGSWQPMHFSSGEFEDFSYLARPDLLAKAYHYGPLEFERDCIATFEGRACSLEVQGAVLVAHGKHSAPKAYPFFFHDKGLREAVLKVG